MPAQPQPGSLAWFHLSGWQSASPCSPLEKRRFASQKKKKKKKRLLSLIHHFGGLFGVIGCRETAGDQMRYCDRENHGIKMRPDAAASAEKGGGASLSPCCATGCCEPCLWGEITLAVETDHFSIMFVTKREALCCESSQL